MLSHTDLRRSLPPLDCHRHGNRQGSVGVPYYSRKWQIRADQDLPWHCLFESKQRYYLDQFEVPHYNPKSRIHTDLSDFLLYFDWQRHVRPVDQVL